MKKKLVGLFVFGAMLSLMVITSASAVTPTSKVSGKITPPVAGESISVVQGGNSCPFVSGTTTDSNGHYSIVVQCPANGQAYLAVNGTVTSTFFSYTAGGDFKHVDATFNPVVSPSISGINPNFGPAAGGNVVQVSGTGFVVGATQVYVGGVSVTNQVLSSTILNALIPAGSPGNAVQVQVITSGGSSPVNPPVTTYTYQVPLATPIPQLPLPIIQALSVQRGVVGDTVTIFGQNFVQGSGVFFDGNPSPSVTVLSSNMLRAVVPTGTGSPAQVRVSNAQGLSLDAGVLDDFYYVVYQTAAPTPTPSPTPTPAPVSQTYTYSLGFRWNLIGYVGQTRTIQPALANIPEITAVYRWDAATQTYQGYFPSAVGIPGANQLTLLENGVAYWVAVSAPVNWTVTLP